jgi:hypothetical protein
MLDAAMDFATKPGIALRGLEDLIPRAFRVPRCHQFVRSLIALALHAKQAAKRTLGLREDR